MSSGFLSTLDWIISLQFLMLGIILTVVFLKNRYVSNFILGMYCFLLFGMNALLILLGNQKLVDYLYLILPLKIIPVLLPVVFFLYLESILILPWKWKKQYSLIFIPSVVVAVCFIFYLFFSTADLQKLVSDFELYRNSYTHKIVAVLALAEFILVLLVQGYKLRQFIAKAKIINSETKFLKWIYGWVVSSIVVVVIGSLYPVFFSDTSKSMLWIPVSMIPFLFMIIYSAFIYPDIYHDIKLIMVWNNEKEGAKSRSTQELELIYKQIESYVLENKVFLKEDISVHTLSVMMNMKPHVISMALNGFLGKNFNSYMNAHRVTEARNRLSSGEYQHMTIEAIGQSVGFRSKSAFYTSFKKETGHTPQYFFSSDI